MSRGWCGVDKSNEHFSFRDLAFRDAGADRIDNLPVRCVDLLLIFALLLLDQKKTRKPGDNNTAEDTASNANNPAIIQPLHVPSASYTTRTLA